jgi:hypothetical protein
LRRRLQLGDRGAAALAGLLGLGVELRQPLVAVRADRLGEIVPDCFGGEPDRSCVALRQLDLLTRLRDRGRIAPGAEPARMRSASLATSACSRFSSSACTGTVDRLLSGHQDRQAIPPGREWCRGMRRLWAVRADSWCRRRGRWPVFGRQA